MDARTGITQKKMLTDAQDRSPEPAAEENHKDMNIGR